MSDVTRLLDAVAAGDRKAAAELLPLVYDELRTLAAARMAAESPGHTLDATALVHEAYLRLVGDQQFDGRGHFFAAAAEAMRRVLVDHARDKGRQKRGGGREQVDLTDIPSRVNNDPDLLLSLDAALTRLGRSRPARILPRVRRPRDRHPHGDMKQEEPERPPVAGFDRHVPWPLAEGQTTNSRQHNTHGGL